MTDIHKTTFSKIFYILTLIAILALGIFAILTWRESIANDRYMALDNAVFDKQTETYLLPADHLR